MLSTLVAAGIAAGGYEVITGIVALAAGGGTGYALGRRSKPKPSPELDTLRAEWQDNQQTLIESAQTLVSNTADLVAADADASKVLFTRYSDVLDAVEDNVHQARNATLQLETLAEVWSNAAESQAVTATHVASELTELQNNFSRATDQFATAQQQLGDSESHLVHSLSQINQTQARLDRDAERHEELICSLTTELSIAKERLMMNRSDDGLKDEMIQILQHKIQQLVSRIAEIEQVATGYATRLHQAMDSNRRQINKIRTLIEENELLSRQLIEMNQTHTSELPSRSSHGLGLFGSR